MVLLAVLAGVSAHGTNAEPLTKKARQELLERANDWAVPQPKPAATLIKIKVFESDDTQFYALGFVEPEHLERALVGFDHWDVNSKDSNDVNSKDSKDVPDLNRLSLADIAASSPFDPPHGVNFGLLTGLQLIRRGNEELGVALIEKALARESGHHMSPFFSPGNEPPVLMLARSCLAAAVNEITSSKPDFPNIKLRVERLLTEEPKLRNAATAQLVESLKANVEHQIAADGTIERTIDDYLLGGGTTGAMSFHAGESSTAERALILKGFAAVPALLSQRHSICFTNHLMRGSNNFPSFPMTAGQVVDGYLQRLANNEFQSNWLERQKGYAPEDDAVLAWWKGASELGEKAYVVKHTVDVDAEGRSRLSSELLLLARERYPLLLESFYQTLLKTSYSSWPVVDAFMQSDVFSREQKIELLKAGVATNNEAHRNWALSRLRELDKTLADESLLAILKQAPTTAQEKYWTDQDANLGRLVSQSADLKVWQAFHSLIDRADLGMRMELIHHLFPPHDVSSEILRSFNEVFVRFHTDETVRDVSTGKKFSGPGAGFPHDRISMRDFVHEHWAQWLKLDIDAPQQDAAPKEWKAFRDAVDAALQKHNSEHGNPAAVKEPRD